MLFPLPFRLSVSALLVINALAAMNAAALLQVSRYFPLRVAVPSPLHGFPSTARRVPYLDRISYSYESQFITEHRMYFRIRGIQWFGLDDPDPETFRTLFIDKEPLPPSRLEAFSPLLLSLSASLLIVCAPLVRVAHLDRERQGDWQRRDRKLSVASRKRRLRLLTISISLCVLLGAGSVYRPPELWPSRFGEGPGDVTRNRENREDALSFLLRHPEFCESTMTSLAQFETRLDGSILIRVRDPNNITTIGDPRLIRPPIRSFLDMQWAKIASGAMAFWVLAALWRRHAPITGVSIRA